MRDKRHVRAMKKIIVKDEIFDRFPDFYRAIVVVRDIENQKSNKRIRRLLKKEIDRRMDIDASKDPRILGWDDAHVQFGSDPNRYLPSIKSLLHRMRSNRALPFVNSVVALFNYTSLKYVLPCGGDDVARVQGDLILGFSDGGERFRPLGGDTEEHPIPGEVIYYDDISKNVMCRRWNWKNGEITKIVPDSKQIVVNVDSLPPITPDIANGARDELAQLLTQHCKAECEVTHLSSEQRAVNIFERC